MNKQPTKTYNADNIYIIKHPFEHTYIATICIDEYHYSAVGGRKKVQPRLERILASMGYEPEEE